MEPQNFVVLSEEIRDAIKAGEWKRLKLRRLWPSAEVAAAELVEIIHDLKKPERVLCFRALPRDIATELFAFMSSEAQEHLLAELSDHETFELLDNLSIDDRTEILAELPGQVTQRLLNLLPPEDLAEARRLLGYPEHSVGRLMSSEYVSVQPEWTVERALAHIRNKARNSETIDMIYVRSRQWKLLDALPLKTLILAKPETLINDLMDDSFISVRAYDDQEEAVRLIQKYDRVALPVIDSDGILIGIVTVDDIIDVAEEETTEDFHKSAAVSPLRVGYWQASVGLLYRSRVGWLSSLVFVNLISSGVIAAFEETLSTYLSLAFFIPLVIATGGNAGAQSATVLTRAIGTGDVTLSQWARVFFRELSIGVLLGVSLALLGFLLGLWRDSIAIGLVVGCTMVIMLIMTNLIGMMLPFIFTRLKIDPAVASGPLITSIADAVGLLIYFSVATAILGLP